MKDTDEDVNGITAADLSIIDRVARSLGVNRIWYYGSIIRRAGYGDYRVMHALVKCRQKNGPESYQYRAIRRALALSCPPINVVIRGNYT